MLPRPPQTARCAGVTRVHRIGRRLVATILVAMTLSSVAAAAPVREAVTAGRSVPPRAHAVLALGDSVPAGTACGCDPFPSEYASLVSRDTRASVTVENAAVSGLDTTGLLAQLQQPGIVAAVHRADVLLVTIGANDFADQHDQVVEGTCALGTTSDCVSDQISSMRTHLTKALAEIRTMRAGRPTSVLVTGYWNVFEDGQVAQAASGTTGLQASIQLTRRVNAAIRSVSGSAGAYYVDLFAPFQQRGADIDSLLAPDGDHPDAAGHRLIASELRDAGLPRLS